jgi:integrase
MQKSGYRPSTIASHSRILRLLSKHCLLGDPETVRIFIATRHVSTGRKENLVEVYRKYANFYGVAFSVPHYRREDSLPFIPQQQEIEALIEASRNMRHATMLRLLYETGMRVGEASRLEFKHLDFERKTVRGVPEKGSKARELKVSEKLCSMLRQCFNQYPKEPIPNPEASRKYMEKTRKYLAQLKNNPRFLNIHLHTLRHFRATMLYHQTKDLLYVQSFLGHRSISNTLRYTQLLQEKEEGGYICKVAGTLEEASGLIEGGFEYVTEMDGIKLFRKRK